MKHHLPKPPGPSIFSDYCDRYEKGSVLQYNSFNFTACPGILHTEIHLFPAIIESLLRVVDHSSMEYRMFLKIYEDSQRHLTTGKIHLAYQGYFDLLILLWSIFVPILDSQVSISYF